MKKLLLILSIISIFLPVLYVHAAAPIKILLVPGHDDEVWGAQYGNIKEADMNLMLATDIYNILKKYKRFEVHITRDDSGYTKEFADYLSNTDEIKSFEGDAKQEMQNEVNDGDFTLKEGNPHITVSDKIAMTLYGINKWADENKMDAVIHVHFNDYPRPDSWTIGKYKGFAIYMPDGQRGNAKESAQLAGNIFAELNTKYITSTYDKELGGLIPDQSLIALGANNTLISSVRSVLIEYGYIYRFGNSAMRHRAYTNMANLTATGIKNYFFKN